MSPIFHKALDAVGIMNIIPDAEASWDREDNHHYGIGQPLYFRPEHAWDHTAYIAMNFYRSTFGDWHVEMEAENDLGGQRYFAPEAHLTDECPVIHRHSPGTVYLTKTGWPLKSIAGGFR